MEENLTKEEIDRKVSSYINSVKNFYAQVKTWLQDTPFKTLEEEFELNEKSSGKYKIPVLFILDPAGEKITKLEPAGAWIIGGAKGRIDMIGKIDRISFLDLDEGGPVFMSWVNVVSPAGNIQLKKKQKSFYKGVDVPGWYYIEERRTGRALRIDQDLFIDFLEGITDYEWEYAS
ncbi:MAG TPA: hypothetical protein VJL89_10690 [Thermodesulfovibrionia bacterium]|nr:hypothetical protein [Thermodesulfovibrionia bacterium]